MSFTYPQPPPVYRPGSKKAAIEKAVIQEMLRLGWVPGTSTRGKITTIRFLFYRLESLGVVEKKNRANGRTDDQVISEVVTDLRYSGLLPLDSIVDDKRRADHWPAYERVVDGVLDAIDGVMVEPWFDHIQIWVESGSLAVALRPIARRYRIDLVPLGGQASVGLLASVAKSTSHGMRILYLGDLDLSGAHIETSAIERVMAFTGYHFDVERLALTVDQVEQYRLPVIEKYDRRTRSRHPAVETEALGQERIEQLVVERLDELLSTSTDFDSISEIEDEDERQRQHIRQMLEGVA